MKPSNGPIPQLRSSRHWTPFRTNHDRCIYARKSTEQTVTDDLKSIARHVEHARAYLQRKGQRVDQSQVYADDEISSPEFARRPGFLRLMNALRLEGRVGLQALLGEVGASNLVTRVGIEPTTIRLKVECSTTELPGRLNRAPLGACYLDAT